MNNNRENSSVTKKQKRKETSTAKKIVFGIFKVNLKIISYIINTVLTVLLIVIITGGIVAGAFAIYIKNYIDPTVEDLQVMASSLDRTTFFYYREYENDDIFAKTGTKWVEWESERLHGVENRFWAAYKQMPDDLINAFIAIEDRRFREHIGVDYLRSGRAVLNYFFPSGSSFGGSTITQQLIKIMTGDDEYKIQRKIQEVLRALYLENQYSKEEILENYLNIVPISNGCYGVQTAAYEFFSKDVSELSLIECAALAAIVNAPYYYDPIRYPENNKKRRQATLENMREYGDLDDLSEEDYQMVLEQDLVIRRPKGKSNENIKSWFTEQVMDEVRDDLVAKFKMTPQQASNMLYSGGLKVYTTMNKSIQDKMEYIYAISQNEVDYFSQFGAQGAQSAMVILDPTNGDLAGIVGGEGAKEENRGWNRASHTVRQPGSAGKPTFIYAKAMELGIIDYGSPIDDAPLLSIAGKPWPTNLPVQWEGLIPTWQAIEVSKNTTTVQLLDKMTPEYIFEFLRDDLGFTSLVDEKILPNGKVLSDIDYAPLAVGGLTQGISVYELTGSYTMLANKGIFSKPRSYLYVQDNDGNTILDNRGIDNQKIILSEENAAIMTKMLMKVVETGTGKMLRMDNIQVAAKTGTTNDDKDRWFVGYTPYYVCGVWYGYDQPKYLGRISVMESPPMKLFELVMDWIHKPIYDDPDISKEFFVPETVITAQYCRDSGMAPGNYCNLDRRGTRILTGYYAKGSEPKEKCNVHVPVKWCTETGSVAGDRCTETITIALVREENRAFPRQVGGIWDVQYTYREVDTSTYIYPSNPYVPFYYNDIPRGTYVGTSGGRTNGFCVEHNPHMALPVTQRPTVIEEKPTDEESKEDEEDGVEEKDEKDKKEEGEGSKPKETDKPDKTDDVPDTTDAPLITAEPTLPPIENNPNNDPNIDQVIVPEATPEPTPEPTIADIPNELPLTDPWEEQYINDEPTLSAE